MTLLKKQSAVVVCPGRGTYNKPELGYLKKYHADKTRFIELIDQYRTEQGQKTVSELDSAETFRASQHTTGDNAASLIYACALADFLTINQDKFDITAVTGNSMGWYLALACANVLTPQSAIEVVNGMGTLMHKEASGGQVIYPLVDDQWLPDPELKQNYENAVALVSQEAGAEIHTSIRLGGMVILAANDFAVKRLLTTLPKVQERYPFALPNHGAFHSPLMRDISEQALQRLPISLFQTPQIPLIDGCGHIWQPYATDLNALHSYTFGHQVAKTYDYTCAVEVAIKEFAPDVLIILGPGSTLGAPTAQTLLQHDWLGMKTKDNFKKRQNAHPFVLSMGIEDQRSLVV
ncbi:MAG: hypothetical protein K9K86_03730 [Pseudomonadales bacterium]|nr:hypothetical protein [Pseudomonadales bacterium]